jgi:dTDP-glucose 4,6-dehydratase
MHLAADTDARRYDEDPIAMLDTIIAGTRRALDFAVARRAKSFLLISSGAVYGRQPHDLDRIPETYGGGPDPTQPKWTYGEAKRTAELLGCLYAERHGLPVKIARCFAFTGPYMPLDQHFAIGNFIRDALDGRPIRVQGDGTPFRSYLYAADLAIWLWTILTQGQQGRPYNVGSENAVTIAEIAHAVAATLAPHASVQIARTPSAGVPPGRYVPSTERARNELNLREWIPLDEAIRRTAAMALQLQKRKPA